VGSCPESVQLHPLPSRLQSYLPRRGALNAVHARAQVSAKSPTGAALLYIAKY
jgi:hypothetical protein